MAERLGPYILEKLIGAGGMADVFYARGPMGVCVVKRPHRAHCSNPEFVRMFLDEAALLAQLHHPGIAQIFDLGHADGAYYLAMEYVPGFDLMTISIEHERVGELMAPELCARIAADAAEALHAAHESVGKNGQPLSLIHRDVSPHNILLSTQGVVKLIDFGVAKAATATHRTQAGLVKGKYPYMSPEQITGQPIDRRVDIYALGLVLYELLTNVRAIAGDTEVAQIENARMARVRPVEQLRPNVPERLRQVIEKAIHPQAAARHQTARELAQDLEGYLVSTNQTLGQEDLLRLFRVVAAEVQGLAPGEAADFGAARLTEREQPATPGVVVLGPGETADVASDPALGAAKTMPTLRQPQPGAASHPPVPATERVPSMAAPAAQPEPVRPIPLTAAQAVPAAEPVRPIPLTAAQAVPVAEPVRPIPLTAEQQVGAQPVVAPRSAVPFMVLGLLAAGVLGAGGWYLTHRPETGPAVENPQPLAAELDAGAGVEVPDAAMALAALDVEADAGADDDTSQPEAEDAGAAVVVHDGRAALVPVSCAPTCDVFVDGKKWGRCPVELELVPGKHLIVLSNREEGFRHAVSWTLKPGDRRPLSVRGEKGTLAIRAQPFALIKLDGKEMGVSAAKDLEVWSGRHDLELLLVDGAKVVAKKKLQVTVEAGKTATVNHAFQLP